MASRLFQATRALSHTTPITLSARNFARTFQTTSRRLETVTPVALPVRKPVGAFRGGLTGFLLGVVLSGAGMYYYVVDEYKVSNQLLTEDIYALQSAVQRIEGYVKTLEGKVTEASAARKS
ncbi:hypothetical protein LTR50_007213 [Elasticomyces elasticus]|nr:hypothetical protein LTR50_007213 [Elasticomyces elasticus]